MQRETVEKKETRSTGPDSDRSFACTRPLRCKLQESVRERSSEGGGGCESAAGMLCEMMAVPKFTHNYKATRDGAEADAGSDLPASLLPSSLHPLPRPPFLPAPAVYAYDLCQCTGGRAYAARCGRGMASCDFRKRRSRKNKQGESRKPRSSICRHLFTF